jgi:hypothetical protein
MLKTIHPTALGAGIALLLAACGGEPDNALVQAGQRAQISGAPARSEPAAARAPAPMQVAVGAAVPADELAKTKQQLALLRREVAEIRQQVARMPGSTLSVETAPDPRSDPTARLEAERVEQQRIASTEAAFRSEKEDARWSQGTVAALRAAFEQAGESLRNQVSSVECRSQSCRVVIGSRASGSVAQDLPLVMSQLGAALPHVTAGQIDQGDGEKSMVLYMSR